MPGAFRLLAAPSQDDPSAPEAGVIASLAGATFDRVVVDLPADSDHREELSEVTNALLLVVPPTHEGMTRARTAAARRPEDRLGFVANRLGAGSDVPMSELVPVLGCPLVAELPCTPALRDAEDEHRLLARPWSRWARGIKRVSRALESQGTA
jgi:hypothetical protein